MVKRFHEKAGKYQKAVCAAISIFAFVCIWQMAVAFTKAGLVLAGPIETLGAFFTAILHPIGTHTIEGHILWSLGRVLIGFAFGSLAGTVLGILMGWFKPVSALLRPIFELLRPIPPIAWIPLSIVWFGLGEMSKYFLIFYSAFCAVTMNAYSGVRSVDPELMGAARMLGANNRQVFTSIVLPSCIPHIFAGLQIAVGTSWATVVAAEMVRSSEGVGWVIIKGQDSNSTVQILVGIVAIGIVGYILAVAMRAIEARLCRWSVRGK
ncbi:MAG: ABC transporter permease [Lachnospiraceae bacterium]|jgi:NitT/TauT family transport system permease protein/sulfonate transport system permease protein|nr:ABC transporter permease [Lachnospiraceae bacterium]